MRSIVPTILRLVEPNEFWTYFTLNGLGKLGNRKKKFMGSVLCSILKGMSFYEYYFRYSINIIFIIYYEFIYQL